MALPCGCKEINGDHGRYSTLLLAFTVDFVECIGMKIDCLPFLELKNMCSFATISMIEILGTYENTFKFLDTVKRLFSRAYVIDAGHAAK
jgi:hypothetical protein